MDFNTNLFRGPTWLAHSSVILHTNCRQKFESYTKTTWYVIRTVRKPLRTTKLVPALPGRFTLTWARVQKHERINYWIEYLKINFLRCLHAETSSLRLFNVASPCLGDDEVFFCCTQLAFAGQVCVRFRLFEDLPADCVPFIFALQCPDVFTRLCSETGYSLVKV